MPPRGPFDPMDDLTPRRGEGQFDTKKASRGLKMHFSCPFRYTAIRPFLSSWMKMTLSLCKIRFRTLYILSPNLINWKNEEYDQKTKLSSKTLILMHVDNFWNFQVKTFWLQWWTEEGCMGNLENSSWSQSVSQAILREKIEQLYISVLYMIFIILMYSLKVFYFETVYI